MQTTEKRVKEIMIEQGLDINNKVLIADLCILYLKAQQDQLRTELKEVGEK